MTHNLGAVLGYLLARNVLADFFNDTYMEGSVILTFRIIDHSDLVGNRKFTEAITSLPHRP